MVLSNITLLGIDVGSSFLKPGDTGIVIVASELTCNLTMNWRYSYSTWVLPVSVSDEGTASIRVCLGLLSDFHFFFLGIKIVKFSLFLADQ